jgi:hypothetical protein
MLIAALKCRFKTGRSVVKGVVREKLFLKCVKFAVLIPAATVCLISARKRRMILIYEGGMHKKRELSFISSKVFREKKT